MDVVGKFENAKKILDECENSQLVLERRKEHIKMAPKFLGNFRAGIYQQLTGKLLHWDKESDGFPLAFTNVHALQKVGKIISDHTCVHFDVEADYIIFKPVVGQKLNGTVNKIAKRHIGCLVHGHFNAWAHHTSSTEKMAASMLMGAEIEITVQEISTSRNVVSIKGKFERLLSPIIQVEDSIQINPASKNRQRRKKKDVQEDAEVEKTGSEHSPEIEVNDRVISKKKDKHKKETDISECPEIEVNDSINSKRKKKHKKETEISECQEIEGNDSVISKKKKKHKKEIEINENELEDPPKESNSHATVNGDFEESPSKSNKKHKKEKKMRERDDNLVNDGSNMDNSIASLTFCEPLFSSTQIDNAVDSECGNKNRKHKKKHKKSNSEAEFNFSLDNSNLPTNANFSGYSDVIMSVSDDVSKQKKAKKRAHEENNFTKLKDSAVKQEAELSEPNHIKKLKMEALDIDFNSSADFEDTSTIKKKEKKKKKHKDNKS